MIVFQNISYQNYMAKSYFINYSCFHFRTFTKGRRPGIKNLRPDSAPPGKFDGHNRSRVSGGEPHPMMAYYNSPQVQRYVERRKTDLGTLTLIILIQIV